MIKNIIFDVGGVIYLQKKFFGDQLVREIFHVSKLKAKESYDIYKHDLIVGKISSRDFLKNLKTHFRSKAEADNLLEKWKKLFKDNFLGINQELIGLIDRLSKSYITVIFTNTIDCHDEYVMELGVYNHFSTIFRSYIEGVLKPETDAYRYILMKLNAHPEECVFIDDLEENVKGASLVGIKGILYKNNRQLMRDLKKFGVKI